MSAALPNLAGEPIRSMRKASKCHLRRETDKNGQKNGHSYPMDVIKL